MAITKLNSQAIPPNTIVESDLSYPLTNFSSTGIDDNASSTQITLTNAATSVDNDLKVDTDTLVVDSTNNRVGIRDSNPSLPLSVNGTARAGRSTTQYIELSGDASSNNISAVGTSSKPLVISNDTTSGGSTTQFRTLTGNEFIWQHSTDGGSIAERMRITSGGRVGINENDPDRILHIKSDVPAVRLEDTDVSGLYSEILMASGRTSIRADESNVDTGHYMDFRLGGTERMRIDDTGNVGIGEPDPSAKLEVNGDVHVTGSGGTKLLVENTAPKITLRDTSVVGAESDEFIIRSTAGQSSGDYEFVLNNDLTSSADQVVMKFSGAGNVGIGLEDPRTVLEVSGSTNRPLTVNSSSATSVVTFTDSATTSIGHVKVGSAGNDLVFYAGASEQARIRAFGGIAFNGDTAAANALDDYEEGTWPVTLSDGTTTSGTLVTGRYTKIGQVVIARFDACNNINPTGFVGGNNVRISLPFTAGSTGRSTGAVIVDGIDRGSRTQVNSKVSDNVAFANIVKSGSNLNDIAVNWSDINSASYVNDIVDFCIVYTV